MNAKNIKGRFITFEGLDGTGKSTQLKLLGSALEERGIEYLVTREPGGTMLGEEVRAILLDSRRKDISPYAELALLFASRAQLLYDVIEPALVTGRWVLCDRFTDSSEAYQGSGRNLGSEAILSLHKILANDKEPWMTVLLDGDPETSVERARVRNSTLSEGDEGRFELESTAFFHRVHTGFRKIAEREPHRVLMVDARKSISEIHDEIMLEIDRRLAREGTSQTILANEFAVRNQTAVLGE